MDFIALIALVVSGATFFYTAKRDRKMDERVKLVEEAQERERAEAVRRRSIASSPYFHPASELANSFTTTGGSGGMSSWHIMDQRLLSSVKPEITNHKADGARIGLVLANSGKRARRISVSGDLQDVEMEQVRETYDLLVLSYRYFKASHGQMQNIKFSFETEDGYRFEHTYETKHGHFCFRRIDPA
jgi:hypothetical protein